MDYPAGKRVYTALPYFVEEVFGYKTYDIRSTIPTYILCMMVTERYYITLSGSSETSYSTLESAIKRIEEMKEGK